QAAEQAPAAAEPAAPAPAPQKHGFLRDVYDVFGAPLVGMAATIAYPLRHPVVSAKAVASAVRHPIATMKSGYKATVGSATSSLSDLDSSQRWYLVGQATFLFAISVYLASLPLL